MALKKPGKVRLDINLVEKGWFSSREKARAAIMTGRVLVDDQPISKPGTLVSPEVVIRLRGEEPRYVSRGGLKLARALEVFAINLAGKVVLDAGASTGGFTDCVLQNGAVRVYAVDVGYGQLAWNLRQDPRVVTLERTNIRYLSPEQLPEKADVATVDVSFISLNKVLPSIKDLLQEEGQIIALIKPQFEAGPQKVGKKGVVRDKAVHQEVILGIMRTANQLGLSVVGLTYSPLLGPEGNIEYFIWLKNQRAADPDAAQTPQDSLAWAETASKTVMEAHEKLLPRP